MPQRHPRAERLAQLVAGELGQEDVLRLGWHLFGCKRCRGRVEALPRGHGLLVRLLSGLPPPEGDLSPAYDSVISRTYATLVRREAELRQERAEAPGLLAELMAHPPARRLVLVDNAQRFHSWGLAELLLARSAKAFFDDPAAAEELARLALEVAERLDPAVHSTPLLNDLKARCWSQVGNARRLGSDHPAAAAAFDRAEACLAAGTDDPLERASFLRMKASLCRDQRRLAEAEELFERAIAIYRRVGDRHQVGTTMVALSNLYSSRAEPERANELLAQAVELIEPEREPLLTVVTRQIHIMNLADAGRFMEARALLVKSRQLFAREGEPTLQLRYLWAQGRIALGLGQFEQAEASLLRARDGWIARKMHYEAAMVSLELATLYGRQGRTADVKQLAGEMLPVFQSLDIRRETLAAFLLFREAAERERTTLRLVEEVRERLRQAPDQMPRRRESQ
jgi:tetratricopeptide (TPR) repeat protein